ncbi:MAG TPA: nickel pincer cofactor biosynthesis protein LarC [Lachnospiraceae bacterium]|nr:nickel pincer cofactor biosynthesis protein LarC [Lachnospiraceae bacterium]
MGKSLYLECESGISGDMTVAALLDLGADETVLRKAMDSLPVKGFSIRVSRVKKAGLDVCDFDVCLDDGHENHDHDMKWLYGEQNEDGHRYDGHSHENHVHDDHAHEIHSHDGHAHRGMREILDIIEQADMTVRAKDMAVRIFTVLGEAEAKAHGASLETVHFHEVGAVDSVVDILSAAVCLDNLDVTELIVPYLCEGQGSIRCQHGLLPIPVPAVTNIVQACGIPIRQTDIRGELVTPTGAAVVGALCTGRRLPESYRILAVGLGAGKREYERPGILRAMMIDPFGRTEDTVYKLESNIDDCTGEGLGYVMERLFAAGARDVHYTPVYMKKNRPGYQLNVVCDEARISELEQIIFRETTTIGIRRIRMERAVLERERRTVATSFGDIEVKVCSSPDVRKVYPEYESVAAVCRRENLPFDRVYTAVRAECRDKLFTS